MRITRSLQDKDVIDFFEVSANTMDDALGETIIRCDDNTVEFDFNSVLLLRFLGVFAETPHDINDKRFSAEFSRILNTIKNSKEDYLDIPYEHIVDGVHYTYDIKSTRIDANYVEVIILCYEKWMETEMQFNYFSKLLGTGKGFFTASTWWIDNDKYKDRFFSSDEATEILGIEKSEDKSYVHFTFSNTKKKAKGVTELYEESVTEEKRRLKDIFENRTDYFSSRTPLIDVNDKLVWVERYGKVVMRYKDGSVRLLQAIDLYLEDVMEELTTLRTQEMLIHTGLINSKVGVWYHQRHFLEGKYYFTGSYQRLMAGEKLYSDDTFTDLLNEQIKKMEQDGRGYESFLHEFRKVHNSIYTEFLDEYKLIIPNIVEGKKLQWVEVRGTVIERDQEGHVVEFVGVNVDVTENMKYQQKIQFLATHDTLTGTRNRNYFENFINEKLPNKYTVIVFDLDGLKLVNDVYGHQTGDEVIINLAEMIKGVYQDALFISRIGGDEFVVLLSCVDIDRIENLNKELTRRIEAYNRKSSVDMNVSFGYSTVEENEDFNKAFVQAENIMYRRKLNNRNSRKSKTLDSILETLNQKTYETREHSERISELAVNTFKALNMTRVNELEDLRLLAKVHDIGKITIDHNILNKPNKLTSTEFEIIKKHSEAGYKIIRNITDSDEVCNGVLFHHERWDGFGYPQGLKGEEIPIFARVISVADSYDAMTNDRVYRARMTHKEAIKEIKDNAGSQFDPQVVEAFLKGNF